MELIHKQKTCYEIYKDHEDKIDGFALDYIDFLNKCKTERETVAWIEDKLIKLGISTDAKEPVFYRKFKNKSIVLVRKGKRSLKQGLRIIGAHLDTPRLDFKQHPIYENTYLAMVKTHYYGGIRKHQWFSIPLAIHGVVVKIDGTKIDIIIGEDAKDPVFVIPDLLPHLAYKQMEKKLSDAFEAEKMNAIIGSVPCTDNSDVEDKIKFAVLDLLNKKYSITEEDLYSAELQFVPAYKAKFVGLDASLIGGYGQDDRICVFSGFRAFLEQREPEFTQILIGWDKEEIGSEGASSARSRFIEYLIQEIIDESGELCTIAEVFLNTRAISADVHGALDPDYQELHDKLNSSKLGYGPVFCKFTGHRGKVGANDANAEYIAFLREKLNKKNIPWQMAELGKVDEGGGGTVAKFLARYGMDIIDFGPGILGMHSPFEISSKYDLYATYLAYREFFN
ncbi:aminopeptidase [Desulfothermus okinawensis JCM 13304]